MYDCGLEQAKVLKRVLLGLVTKVQSGVQFLAFHQVKTSALVMYENVHILKKYILELYVSVCKLFK